MHYHVQIFYVGAGNPNSGTYVYLEGCSLVEPSLEPLNMDLIAVSNMKYTVLGAQ